MDSNIKKRRRKNKFETSFIVFCTFFVLLFLVLISTWKMTGLVAKFASTDTSNDDVQTAKFININSDVSIGEDIIVKFNPTKSVGEKRTFVIKNTGEVDITCTFESSSYDVLPLTVSFDKNNFNMKPGEQVTVVVTIAWDTSVAGYNDYKYNNLTDLVKIKLTCTQID